MEALCGLPLTRTQLAQSTRISSYIGKPEPGPFSAWQGVGEVRYVSVFMDADAQQQWWIAKYPTCA